MKGSVTNRLRLVSGLPWYVLLFGYSQILAFYAGNAMSVVALGRPGLYFTLASVLLTCVLALVVRSLSRAGLAMLVVLLAFRNAPVLGAVATIFVGVAAAIVVALTMRQFRISNRLRFATKALNTFGVALLAVTLIGVLASDRAREIPWDLWPGADFDSLSAAGPQASADPRRPDVYVIMLDGYPRRDTLQRLFDFDNSPFIASLEERGFNVADASRSNYMYTSLTLTSVLNMRQIKDIGGIDGEDSLRIRINHNPTFDTFRAHGYRVLATAAGWEADAMRSADAYCGGNVMNDFELNLVGHSLAGRLIELSFPSLISDRDRASVNTALDCIGTVATFARGQPRMLFAHVPSPHLPVVFAKDGSAADRNLYGHTVPGINASYAEFAHAYTDELQYLNGRVLGEIDEIRRASRIPPVIVVFSDHGSESHLDWDDARRGDLRERFSNFFAASTPGASELYGEAPTPVNLFSILLDHYLDAEIPLASDESYVSRVQDRLGLTPAPAGVADPSAP